MALVNVSYFMAVLKAAVPVSTTKFDSFNRS